MMRQTGVALVSLMLLAGFSGTAHALEPDVIQAQLAAPPEQVKQAVTQVLANSGYQNIVWKDNTTLTTGYREVKSRVEATVTPGTDQTTQLSLHVMTEGKRTFFDSFAPVKTQYPESPENQLRLIKNKLKIVSHPYTTQSFFKLQ
jgi:hypothetical protein